MLAGDKHRSGAPRRVHSGKPQQTTVPKIKEALNFMKKHSFEVPFIANYRREYVEPELDVHDLWKTLRCDEKVRGLLVEGVVRTRPLVPTGFYPHWYGSAATSPRFLTLSYL